MKVYEIIVLHHYYHFEQKIQEEKFIVSSSISLTYQLSSLTQKFLAIRDESGQTTWMIRIDNIISIRELVGVAIEGEEDNGKE